MDDAELQLIIDACRSLFARQPRQLELRERPLDWGRVLALSRRHRVQAALWAGLEPVREKIPADSAVQLRTDAEDVVRSNLQISVESDRLLRLFRSEGVNLIFLKGLPLAALAYPDPFLKMGWDIDLLVPPDRIADSCRLLRRAGYAPVFPESASDQQLSGWHVSRKESVWRSDDGRFHIDLHSRLSDNPRLLAKVGAQPPQQIVALSPGIELPTLSLEILFAYLCVHGASSAWFRLKWAMDLAALLASKTPGEIQELYDRSQQLGSGRAAAQALLLVDRLFGADVPPRLREKLENDFWNRWLANVARRELATEAEPTGRHLGTSMIHLSQLVMMPGLAFAISEAGRQLSEFAGRALAHPTTR